MILKSQLKKSLLYILLFNLLELDVECGKFEIPFGNLVTRNHKKIHLLFKFWKKDLPTNGNLPQGKKEENKTYYFSIFFI